MHKFLAFSLSLLLTLSGSTTATATPTAKERALVESILEEKVTEEELLVALAIMSDLESNYDTASKMEELQKYYISHNARSPYRLGWVTAKMAYYNFLKGQVALSSKQCSQAIGYLKHIPDPLHSDACYFYKHGLDALYPTLNKLKRQQEGDKIRQQSELAERYLGSRKARHLLIASAIFLLKDDLESMMGFAELAIKEDANFCGPYFMQAIGHFEKRQTERAKNDLKTALQLWSNFPSAYVFLGRLELEKKNTEQATRYLDTALSMSSAEEDDEARSLRGWAKALKRDFAGALEDFSEAIKGQSKEWVLYACKADCLLHLRRYEESSKDWTQAITFVEALNPKKEKLPSKTKAIMYYERGLALEGSSQTEKALADFDKAIELDPSNKELFKSRGELRILQGDNLGVSDFDEYSKLTIAEENSTFVSRKDQQDRPGMVSSKKKKNADDAEKSDKPSWLSEGPSTTVSTDSKKESKADEPRKEEKKEETVAAEAAKPKDTYLVYIENKLLQVSSVKAGAAVEKGSLKIEPDGVPVLVDKSEKNKTLYDLIMRAAPFKAPSTDKPGMIDLEYDPGTGTVKVQFQP